MEQFLMLVSFGRTEMVANTKYTFQPEVNISFSASPEGDSSDPGSEETTPSHNEGSGRNDQNGKQTHTVKEYVALTWVALASQISEAKQGQPGKYLEGQPLRNTRGGTQRQSKPQ